MQIKSLLPVVMTSFAAPIRLAISAIFSTDILTRFELATGDKCTASEDEDEDDEDEDEDDEVEATYSVGEYDSPKVCSPKVCSAACC